MRMRGEMERDLEIVRVDYGHPDAVRLIEAVQAEYVARYGGRDDSPVDPMMFVPPAGSFFVGYAALDGAAGGTVAAASGAWRRSGVERLGTSRTAEIKRMYVVPAAQRRGLARQMLAHLETTARAAGHDALILETGLRQPEAIALYDSAGYVPIEGFGHFKDEPLSRCFGKRLD